MMEAKQVLVCGAVLAFLGVAFGAMGAHALQAYMDERGEHLFALAAQYHLLHALGLLTLGLTMKLVPETRLLPVAALAMLAGIFVFSGTLYAMALGAPRWFGAITPLGGLALLVAWLLFAIGVARSNL